MVRYHGKGVGRREETGTGRRECAYHQCENQVGRIKECPYCKGHFCEYHFTPIPPSVVDISNASHEELENWRRKDVHPCFAYTSHYNQKKEFELKAAKDSLDRMKYGARSSSNEHLIDGKFETDEDTESPPVYTRPSSWTQTHYTKKTDSSEHKTYSQRGVTGGFWKTIKTGFQTLFRAILLPFVWLYNGLSLLLNAIIIKPLTWLYEEIQNTLYHSVKGAQHLSSALYALVKIAIFLGLCYIIFTFIWNSNLLDGKSNILSNVQNLLPSVFAKNCTVNLSSGQCSSNKPLYCDNGNFIERSDICGCQLNYRAYNHTCVPIIYCQDGSLDPDCSQNKPYQCINGTLVEKSTLCGCPPDFRVNNDSCKKIQKCTDGTEYDQCSATPPLYCINGVLANFASKCGCPADTTPSGDECVEQYMTGPSVRYLQYTLRGQSRQVDLTVYKGLNDLLASQEKSYTCYSGACPSQGELDRIFIDRKINQAKQEIELKRIADGIRGLTSNRDDQARIAISMVQNIPYDYTALNTGLIKGRYPYQVIYDNSGVCGEKAPLLAALLKELGYSVVLFDFGAQPHQAVGIKCPMQYSFRNSGYCFVESTIPSIITDDQGNYVGVGKLTSVPTIIQVSDGASFDSVAEEYNDARAWIQFQNAPGQMLDQYSYSLWAGLVRKYGIKITGGLDTN